MRIESKLLTEFWGRPMHLGAHVLVPEGFDEHLEARYPLMVFHGHFPYTFGGFREEPPDPDLESEYSARFDLEGYNRIVQEQAHQFYKEWTRPDFPRAAMPPPVRPGNRLGGTLAVGRSRTRWAHPHLRRAAPPPSGRTTREVLHGPALDHDQMDLMAQEVDAALCPDCFGGLVHVLEGQDHPHRQRTARRQWPMGLTDREVEVLRLIAKGMNRAQVADALIVSESTVRSHLEHIYSKAGVNTRAAATMFAMEHALV